MWYKFIWFETRTVRLKILSKKSSLSYEWILYTYRTYKGKFSTYCCEVFRIGRKRLQIHWDQVLWPISAFILFGREKFSFSISWFPIAKVLSFFGEEPDLNFIVPHISQFKAVREKSFITTSKFSKFKVYCGK